MTDVISHDPGAVGRSTAVLDATSDRWPETGVVVKASWPGSDQIPETIYLEAAKEAAEKLLIGGLSITSLGCSTR